MLKLQFIVEKLRRLISCILCLLWMCHQHCGYCIWQCFNHYDHRMSRHDKTNKMSVRPAKTQISLGIPPIWSESPLCAQWVHVAKDPRFLHADSEDSDQTGRMPRLIWVFAGRTATLLVLSYRGSYYVASDSVIKPCIKNDNPLVDKIFKFRRNVMRWRP